jgi:hypothetical protein
MSMAAPLGGHALVTVTLRGNRKVALSNLVDEIAYPYLEFMHEDFVSPARSGPDGRLVCRDEQLLGRGRAVPQSLLQAEVLPTEVL